MKVLISGVCTDIDRHMININKPLISKYTVSKWLGHVPPQVSILDLCSAFLLPHHHNLSLTVLQWYLNGVFA